MKKKKLLLRIIFCDMPSEIKLFRRLESLCYIHNEISPNSMVAMVISIAYKRTSFRKAINTRSRLSDWYGEMSLVYWSLATLISRNKDIQHLKSFITKLRGRKHKMNWFSWTNKSLYPRIFISCRLHWFCSDRVSLKMWKTNYNICPIARQKKPTRHLRFFAESFELDGVLLLARRVQLKVIDSQSPQR